MGNLLLSLKTALISTGVLLLAVILKLSVPLISDFVFSDVPAMYSIILSYLRPPYLYLLINCIIISIVASSKLHHKLEPEPQDSITVPAVQVQPSKTSFSTGVGEISAGLYRDEVVNRYGTVPVVQVQPSKTSVSAGVSEISADFLYSDEAVNRYVDVRVDSEAAAVADGGWQKEKLVRAPERVDSMELSSLLNETEKPSVSKRFSHVHRKPLKSTPEGKALRVSKSRRQETLESTWKTITEGRPMPLTRHLKKSDTWERVQKDHNAPPPPLPNMVKKSETFSNRKGDTTTVGTKKVDSVLSQSPGSGKLRKEPSLSQDDLNRRVEAFIRKFNEEMRLQRQESLNQYQEMIRRGAQ